MKARLSRPPPCVSFGVVSVPINMSHKGQQELHTASAIIGTGWKAHFGDDVRTCVVRDGRWSGTTRAYATANTRQRQSASVIATSFMVRRTAHVETGVELSLFAYQTTDANAKRMRAKFQMYSLCDADADDPQQGKSRPFGGKAAILPCLC